MLLGGSSSKVNLLRIFIQSIVIIYIGYEGNQSYDYSYLILLGLSLLIPILVPIPDLKNVNRVTANQLFNYIILLPLFIYISYSGFFDKNINDSLYTLLLIIGCIQLIYYLLENLIKLFQ